MLGLYCDKSVKLRWDEEGGGFPDSPVADEEFIDLEVCADIYVCMWFMCGEGRTTPVQPTYHPTIDSLHRHTRC